MIDDTTNIAPPPSSANSGETTPAAQSSGAGPAQVSQGAPQDLAEFRKTRLRELMANSGLMAAAAEWGSADRSDELNGFLSTVRMEPGDERRAARFGGNLRDLAEAHGITAEALIRQSTQLEANCRAELNPPVSDSRRGRK
jgi:hypothetical protein